MAEKLVIDLAANYESEKIYFGNHRGNVDEFAVNVSWSGATTSGGTIEVITYFDENEAEAYDVLGTILINAATGRETVFGDIDIDAIKIKYTKVTSAVGTANVFVRLTSRD